MERKNTMLLTVIAIATLLVAVVGATFAYFTATVTGEGTTNVTATTAALDTTTASGTALSLEVLIGDMNLSDGSDDLTEDVAKSAEGTLALVSTVGSTGRLECTYDIVYTDASAEPYVKSQHATDLGVSEFVLSGAAVISGGSNTLNEVSYLASEQFDFATLTATSGKETTLVSGAKFTTTEGGTDTLTWTFTAKMFNLAGDQSEIAGKNYSGAISFVIAENGCTNIGSAE